MEDVEEAAVTVESLRLASVPKLKPPDGRAPDPNAGTEGVDVAEPKGLDPNADVGVGVGAAAGAEGAAEKERALGLAKLNGEGAEGALPNPKDGADAVGAADADAPFMVAAGALGADAKGLEAPAGALNEGKVGVETLGVLGSVGFGAGTPNIGVAEVGADAAGGNNGLGTDGGLGAAGAAADGGAGKVKPLEVAAGFGAEGAVPIPAKRLLGTEAGLAASSFLSPDAVPRGDLPVSLLDVKGKVGNVVAENELIPRGDGAVGRESEDVDTVGAGLDLAS